MSGSFKTSNDPMKYKSGKPRLGPLNVDELTKLLGSCRNKHKAKVQKALDKRKLTQQTKKVVE